MSGLLLNHIKHFLGISNSIILQWVQIKTNDSAEIQDFLYPCAMKACYSYHGALSYSRTVELPRVHAGTTIPNLEMILHSYSDYSKLNGMAVTTADTYLSGSLFFTVIGRV